MIEGADRLPYQKGIIYLTQQNSCFGRSVKSDKMLLIDFRYSYRVAKADFLDFFLNVFEQQNTIRPGRFPIPLTNGE